MTSLHRPETSSDLPFVCECGASFATRAELDVHKGLDYENDSLIGRTFDDFALDSEPAPACSEEVFDRLADGEG
jgi:hypothetical protein